jgi:hemerythrin-like domain-containing protein
MARHHDKLGSISQEHHEGLLFAIHLQQGEKILAKTRSYNPIHQARYIVDFYNLHLAQHFKIEEKYIFPLINKYVSTLIPLVKELTEEHRKIEQMVDEFRQEPFENLTTKLRAFGKLLEAHIHKEDRQLFPAIKKHTPVSVINEIENTTYEVYKERKSPEG